MSKTNLVHDGFRITAQQQKKLLAAGKKNGKGKSYVLRKILDKHYGLKP